MAMAYFNRQKAAAEKNYHSYELETLVIVETLKKYTVYLVHKNITEITNCNAIKTS